MFKVFEGANGYYVAQEDAVGFHNTNTAQQDVLGWNKLAAQNFCQELNSVEDPNEVIVQDFTEEDDAY